MKFTKIIIIYNPNSTGDSKKNAKELSKNLKKVAKKCDVKLVATKRTGHGEEIAEKYSAARHFIVSSSGDGGYHEVVNGIMKKPVRMRATLGLLPSGNANDHYRHMHRGDLMQRIQKNDTTSVEVLELRTNDSVRYAHSYIGVGITPHIGEELTKANLNRLNEAWLVIKHLVTFSPVKIKINGKVKRYQNLLCTNVSEMSKIIKLSKKSKSNDGKFEVTHQSGASFIGLLRHLFRASTVGLEDEVEQVTSFSFTTTQRLKVQLDGEVFRLKKNQAVMISVQQNAIKTII